MSVHIYKTVLPPPTYEQFVIINQKSPSVWVGPHPAQNITFPTTVDVNSPLLLSLSESRMCSVMRHAIDNSEEGCRERELNIMLSCKISGTYIAKTVEKVPCSVYEYA